MTNRELSNKPADILAFIEHYIQSHKGQSPTVREIQAACGISSEAVVDYNLEKLEAAELITRKPRQARSIQLVSAEVAPIPADWMAIHKVLEEARAENNRLKTENQKLRSAINHAIKLILDGRSAIAATALENSFLEYTRPKELGI